MKLNNISHKSLHWTLFSQSVTQSLNKKIKKAYVKIYRINDDTEQIGREKGQLEISVWIS